MSAGNPTVTLLVTERELSVLTDKIGWSSPYITLRDKLLAANKDMKEAKRLKNRFTKLARKAQEAGA